MNRCSRQKNPIDRKNILFFYYSESRKNEISIRWSCISKVNNLATMLLVSPMKLVADDIIKYFKKTVKMIMFKLKSNRGDILIMYN